LKFLFIIIIIVVLVLVGAAVAIDWSIDRLSFLKKQLQLYAFLLHCMFQSRLTYLICSISWRCSSAPVLCRSRPQLTASSSTSFTRSAPAHSSPWAVSMQQLPISYV